MNAFIALCLCILNHITFTFLFRREKWSDSIESRVEGCLGFMVLHGLILAGEALFSFWIYPAYLEELPVKRALIGLFVLIVAIFIVRLLCAERSAGVPDRYQED